LGHSYLKIVSDFDIRISNFFKTRFQPFTKLVDSIDGRLVERFHGVKAGGHDQVGRIEGT